MSSSDEERSDGSTGEPSEPARLPEKFCFDPQDDFYMAPPVCQLLHYRHAAILAGMLEVALLFCAMVTFLNLHLNGGLIGLWSSLSIILILTVACVTTGIMIYGITTEKSHLLWPQMTFLNVEIALLLLGALLSIASMSLGIEWTHTLCSFFVSVPLMEDQFGPIWPFNVAIVSFSGAALGIWFHVIIQGCYDFMLDKEYFSSAQMTSIEMSSPKPKKPVVAQDQETQPEVKTSTVGEATSERF